MPGPPPKSEALRQRRNRPATAGALPPEPDSWLRDRAKGVIPPLPNRGRGRAWDKRTRAWWERVWTSPMRVQYMRVHLEGLLSLAELVDARNKLPAADMLRLKLEAEIRLQSRDYGLTPMDLRRLDWRPESQTTSQAGGPTADVDDSDDVDARAVLRVVS